MQNGVGQDEIDGTLSARRIDGDPLRKIDEFEVKLRQPLASRGNHIGGTVDAVHQRLRKTRRQHLGRIAGAATDIDGDPHMFR